MTAAAIPELRSLKAHPFELLREMERRSKAAIAGSTGNDVDVEEWVGIACRVGDEHFIVPRNFIREVLMMPESLTRVPGAKHWVKGLANVRGHLLPLVDLRAYLGGGTGGVGRTARALSVNSTEMPVGLIVDEVYGFRRFLETEHSAELPEMIIRCERFLDGAYRRGEDVWPVFQVDRLINSEDFRRAAED